MLLQILGFLTLMSIPQGARCAYRLTNCSNALGMQSGEIKDEDITGSSFFGTEVLPKFGRLGCEAEGEAWCPNDSEESSWLQIDLHQRHTLTGIATQGRYAKGQGKEYIESFILQYYDPLHNKWQYYSNNTNSNYTSIEGNNDTNSIKTTIFDNPIMADKVRIFPIKGSKTICLRVELYGCLWPEGIVRIDVQQGNGKSLENGAVPLLDCIFPSLDTNERWMVWSNAALQGQPLEISFEFDKIRAFQAVHLLVKKPFKSANITFSIDGKYYSNPQIWQPDEGSNLTCNLDNQIGRYLKIQLIAKGQSLSLGEINFNSSLYYYDYDRYYHTIDEQTSTCYNTILILSVLIICGFVGFAIMASLYYKKQRRLDENIYSTIHWVPGCTNSKRGTVSADDEFTPALKLKSTDNGPILAN